MVDLQEMGLGDDCEPIALVVTERIRSYWGGCQIYIPMGRCLEVSKKSKEIEARFNGRNTRELCRCYGLTQRHLYRVVNQIRAARREKLAKDRDISKLRVFGT